MAAQSSAQEGPQPKAADTMEGSIHCKIQTDVYLQDQTISSALKVHEICEIHVVHIHVLIEYS